MKYCLSIVFFLSQRLSRIMLSQWLGNSHQGIFSGRKNILGRAKFKIHGSGTNESAKNKYKTDEIVNILMF